MATPVTGWLAGLVAGLGVLALVGHQQGAVTGDGYGAAIEIGFAAALVGQAIAR
jgi:cobalamin synthase